MIEKEHWEDQEWLGEGLRNFSQLRGVNNWYNSYNKIVQITKVVGKPIVAIGDEVGTIRFFNYPNTSGEAYYQCYSDHLYTISNCMFSQDNKFFFSTCLFDRCIFKWAVTVHTKKVRVLNNAIAAEAALKKKQMELLDK